MILLDSPGVPRWGRHAYHKTTCNTAGTLWVWDWYTDEFSRGGLIAPISPYW